VLLAGVAALLEADEVGLTHGGEVWKEAVDGSVEAL
jgi:hypothetical protein